MAARTRKIKHEEKTKDEIRGTQLVNMLCQVGLTGKYNGFEVDPNRITAARAALPFLRPSYSAVEQTVINSSDAMSEADINQKLIALLEANPGLIDTITAMKASVVQGVGQTEVKTVQ